MIEYDEYEREALVFDSLTEIYKVIGNIDEGIEKLDAIGIHATVTDERTSHKVHITYKEWEEFSDLKKYDIKIDEKANEAVRVQREEYLDCYSTYATLVNSFD